MDARSKISEALRHMGRSTTPEELRKDGVKRVRALKSEEILRLIETAVERAFQDKRQEVHEEHLREAGLGDEHRAEVVQHARRHLSGLRDVHQTLSDAMARLHSEREVLRSRPALRPGSDEELRLLKGRVRRMEEVLVEVELQLGEAIQYLVGRPSGFRDEQRAQEQIKRELVSGLFAENQELRERLRRRQEGA